MRFRFGGVMMALFGAVLAAHGDDITLLSTATRDEIQAALDARNDGSTVTLPAGTYDIDETISITTDVKLKGAGMYATILKATERFDEVLALNNKSSIVSGVCVTNAEANSNYASSGIAVVISSGRMENSRVTGTKNSCGNWNRFGAVSLHNSDAVLSHCRIDHNQITGTGGRGTVSASGGALVENCLIDHNTAQCWGGGILCGGACSIVNCTIVDNTANGSKGGGIWCDNKNAKIINCLVRRNIGSGADSDIYLNAAGTVKHTACREGVGTDSVSADPEFKDPDNGDYTLLVSSPCLDAGSESDATAAIGSAVATDFAGATRVMGSEIEIGCYEYDPSQTACAFAADTSVQHLGSPVRLTASTSGFGDAADIVYSWSLLLAGESTPVAKTGSPLDFTAAKPGYYSVSLTASSASAGKSCSSSKSDYFYVAPLTNYVTSAKVGTAVFPYGTPETAATNISDAVGAAIDGSVIYLPAGVHDVSACVSVTKNLRIVGDGSDATILKATGTFDKIFYLYNKSAVVSGVCVSNLVSNGSGQDGTAVIISAGRLEYSRVTCCKGNGNWNRKGTVSLHSADAVVSHCRIDHNTMTASGDWGGGLMATGGGLVENCLIDHNTAQCYGGVYCYGACSIVNCTIVDNTGNSGSGGGLCCDSASAKVINCLVRRNTGGGADADLLLKSGTVKYTASREGAGTDPVSADPEFKDPANGDYTLLVSSPCVDAGSTNEAKTAIGADAVTDYAGLTRVMGKEIDIGCFEYDTSQAACAFFADKSEQHLGSPVRLTARTSGFGEATDVVYSWSLLLAGESTPVEATGSPLDFTATKPGRYSVSLTASSESAKKSCSSSKTDYFYVAPLTNYVTNAKVDTAAFPYGTPATAATNISDAVDAAIDGSVIYLPAGTYEVGSCVSVTKDIRITGEGKDATILKATETFDKFFYLNNKSAVVSGVCVSNLVSNGGGQDGTAVIISAGRLEDSRVTCCAGNGNWNRHGTVSLHSADAVLSHCRIDHNTMTASGDYGGGVMVTGGGVVENCLIDNNTAFAYGGVYLFGAGALVNCTVVDNAANNDSGGGIGCCSVDAKIVNCIVRRNVASSADSDIYLKAAGTVSHTASREGVGTDPVSDDPEFKDPANGDYALLASSPCIDAGSTNEAETAIGAAVEKDCAGATRVMGDEIEMGCYEYDPSQAACAFSADAREQFLGTPVRLTASTSGFGEATDIAYSWSLCLAGESTPIEASGSPIDFTATKPGRYSVSLTATSESAGLAASLSKTDYFYVAPLTNYVTNAKVDTAVFPYGTPATAATNISDAVGAAIDGSVVYLPAGTYDVDGTITITRGVRFAGEGREATVLKASAAYNLMFYLNNKSIVMSGVCISNVVAKDSGAQSGYAVVISAGRLEDSRVTHCSVQNGNNRKGAVSLQSADAVLSRCRIDHNTMTQTGSQGGGVMATGGALVENCLIDNNTALSVGGLYCAGACSVVNCTVISNRETSATEGVGVYAQNGQIHNTIIVDNLDKDGVESNIYGKDYFSYSLSPSFPKAKNGNIVDRPIFKAAKPLVLRRDSPGQGKGSTVGYEELLIGGRDLFGHPRCRRIRPNGQGILDPGCTESAAKSGCVLFVR